MTKGYIDLENEVYDIYVEFKTLSSLIDTLHVAMSGDQVLDNDTIMTYTEIMKNHADSIEKRLWKATDMDEGQGQSIPVSKDPLLPGK